MRCSSHRGITLVPIALALLVPGVCPGSARAQTVEGESSAARADTISTAGISPRAKTTRSMLMPPGSYTLGADLAFITAEEGALGPGDVGFTDVVFFRPRARYTVNKRLELFAGTTLLPKQPSFTDELVWQGGNLGALIGVSRYAIYIQGSGGPMMNENGWWSGADIGVQARKFLEQIIVFQGSLGVSGTYLHLDFDTDEPFWFTELATHGELLFQTPYGEAAAWIGVDYYVPLYATATDPDPVSGAFIDPQNRVNFHLGGVLAFLDRWDIYFQYSILDRGDIISPETVLPILEGGFDQHQIVFGVLRRFHKREAPRAFMAR